MSKSKQVGFTLIELVVVIVILGILAAFAVPRFMGLESQARVASVNALEGTLRSASAMAHGVWLASGSPAAGIVVDGQTITMANGYPNRATLANAIDGSVITTSVPPAPGRFSYNANNGVFTLNGATNTLTCRVTYTQATAIVPPVIAALTTTC
jgi:MSHA pilin protein MshA